MRAYKPLLYVMLALAGLPAHASNKKPPAPKEELQKTEKEMQAAQTRKEQIEEQTSEVEEELAELQSQLVKLASTAQHSESDLSASEDRLRILNTQLAKKTAEFKSRQHHLSALVQASIKLSHTPPEAMVMMPGDVTSTMKAARALKMASDSVRAEAQSLGLQMAELQKLKDKVAKNRDELATRQATLDSQRKDLVEKLKQRKTLQRQLGQQAKQTGDRLALLARKTEDLQQLVEKVEQDRKTEADEKTAAENTRKKARSHSFKAAKGHIRTPVSGKLLRRFGSSEGKNTTSKGLTIATRARAAVTAPFDGEVVFTGPFLQYGQMVIIHHSDNFHTLLAGLQKIDVEVGQFLLEGEPIGAMGEGTDEQELYVELRNDNQPIDPAPWMSAFSKRP